MTGIQSSIKRLFDLFFACAGIIVLWPILGIVAILVMLTSRGEILFCQKRVGRYGKLFTVYKFRTMVQGSEKSGTITTATDARITRVGRFLRRFKLDELPQLFNVLMGSMSFVGPRPDVPGYADKLTGEDACILKLRPGITGPATLHFKNEETLLALAVDPKVYNDTVIWPKKIELNREYAQRWSFLKDIEIVLKSVLPIDD